MSFGGNSSQQGQRLAQAFYANYDSSGMPTMRLQEMVAAMNYSKTLGNGEAEQFKAGFFKGMANFIKQNRGFTPAQFMNTMANVYNNLDWGGANVNGKDETSRNLGQLQGFLGEMTGGVAKEFGFKKGIIGGYDDGVRGATALVLGDDGKAEFQTVREGSVLTKSRLLWEGDNTNVTLTSAKAAPANGQGGGASSGTDLKELMDSLNKATKPENLRRITENIGKLLQKQLEAAQAGLNPGSIGDLNGATKEQLQSIIDALEAAKALLPQDKQGSVQAQIDGLKAMLADIKPKLNPTTTTTVQKDKEPKPPLDLDYVKKNLNNYDVYNYVAKKDYIPNEVDVALARKNPDTHFARGIGDNPNFKPTENDIGVARNKPYTLFAGSVASNPNFKPTDFDSAIARSYPASNFASSLSENPNFTPTNTDIGVAKTSTRNANTLYAYNLALNQNYHPTHSDIAFATEKPDTLFASGIAQNPNYKPTSLDIAFARNNPNTDFAAGVMQNPNYKPTDADTEFAKKNPDTSFAYGVAKSKDPVTRFVVARNLAQIGQNDKSLKVLDTVPLFNSPMLDHELALLYLQLGQKDKAQQMLETLYPDKPSGWAKEVVANFKG